MSAWTNTKTGQFQYALTEIIHHLIAYYADQSIAEDPAQQAVSWTVLSS